MKLRYEGYDGGCPGSAFFLNVKDTIFMYVLVQFAFLRHDFDADV